MKVFRGLDNLPQFHNAVATMGSFDGVHSGHRELLRRVMDIASHVDGESIVLTFDHAEGMHSSDGAMLRTFEIADELGIYHPAEEIEIKDNTIRLQSKAVKHPMRARYGWQPFTRANLVNSEKLPSSTFEIAAE